jgi:hypothetical protein
MNDFAEECMHCKARLRYMAILCGKCGRTASKDYYAKKQPRMKDNKALLYFGTRDIPFGLVTRDLRKMPRYAQHWQRHAGEEGWKIDFEAEALEAYQRRLGRRPHLNSLLAILSPFRDEHAIPEYVRFKERDVIFLDDPKGASWLRALQMCNPEFGSGSKNPHISTRGVFLGNVSVVFDAKQRRGVSFLLFFVFLY